MRFILVSPTDKKDGQRMLIKADELVSISDVDGKTILFINGGKDLYRCGVKESLDDIVKQMEV